MSDPLQPPSSMGGAAATRLPGQHSLPEARVAQIAVAGGSFFATLMISLCCWSLYDSRVDAFTYARDTLQNLALVVEHNVERNIELYGLALDGVVTGVAQADVMALPAGLRRQLLFDRAASTQYLGSMLVLDAHGNVVIDSTGPAPPHANFADRPYFTVHRDHPDAGLYISDPFNSRLRNGAPSIALSRRLSRPDGSFAGVAVLTVRLEHFPALFARLALGPHAVVALLKTNGMLIMREPDPLHSVGQSFVHAPVFAHIGKGDAGAFVETTQLDGVRRLYAYRKIPGLPLVVTIGAAESAIYAPWQRRSAVIGALIVISALGLVALSMMLGAQLRRRMRAESELALLARTDALTGLVNRRTLGEILDAEWRRTQRTRHVFSLLFVDVDYFKAYNDAYGHQAGDDALTAVAHCIADNVRQSTDTVARYGGEEFVIVLPDNDASAAAVVAKKLLNAIDALHITHTQSQFGHITASIGVASWDPVRYPTPSDVIKAADDALYRAKALGRNRAIMTS